MRSDLQICLQQPWQRWWSTFPRPDCVWQWLMPCSHTSATKTDLQWETSPCRLTKWCVCTAAVSPACHSFHVLLSEATDDVALGEFSPLL